jgi:hypothetical protein
MLSFNRTIAIVCRGDAGDGRIRAALEDDYHHFRVALTIHNGITTSATGTALRTPYSLCGEATTALEQLRGAPVQTVAHSINQYTDARLQCTHQLDLAGLGLAALARGDSCRRYHITVPRHVDGCTAPRLWRDGQLLLQWQVESDVITSPGVFTGIALREGMASWAIRTLEPALAEAALVLRRATLIAIGRLRDLDQEIHARPWGRCFAQQPERATRALRVIGSTRDFSGHTEDLCAADQAWLATTPPES